MSVLTMILGGGTGARLSVLTQQRSKPALPFGGKYRIIDFTLSSIVNSYLSRIALLTQYQAHSLIEHIGTGEPWGLNQRPQNGIQIWQPYPGRTDQDKYTGTANAVYQNRKFIAEDGSETLLILSGDFVYKLDYRNLLRFHQEKHADLTISAMPVPAEQSKLFGMLQTDDQQRITAFVEKPEKTTFTHASMGIYVFNTQFLLDHLEEDAHLAASRHDFGRDIIPAVIEEGNAYAYPFSGYWMDIGSIKTYYDTNLALLDPQPALTLYDSDWVIHTRCAEKPPAKIRQPGQVIDSLVSDGCIIEGVVIHSVLSPGVRVEKGAVVRDAVILNDTVIHAGAQVRGCILDKVVDVGEEAQIGIEDSNTPNQQEPTLLNSGITVVGKWARIPARTNIGRNCRIDISVEPKDFPGLSIPAGSTGQHSD